ALHRLSGAGAHWTRVCDVARVGRRPIADELGDDRGSPVARRAQLLEDENARTLSHHEAVTGEIKRTAGPARLDIARRDRTRRTEGGQRQRGDAGLTAARDHRHGVATPDGLERLTDRVRAATAG